jgi:hypothetical protein
VRRESQNTLPRHSSMVSEHPKMKPGPGVADNLYRRTRQVPKVRQNIFRAGGSFSPDHGSYNVTSGEFKPWRATLPFSATCLGMVAWSASEGATQWQLSAQTRSAARSYGTIPPTNDVIRILPLSLRRIVTPQAPS